MYSACESDGYVQPVLTLSSPYSAPLTVRVRERSITAYGEL